MHEKMWTKAVAQVKWENLNYFNLRKSISKNAVTRKYYGTYNTQQNIWDKIFKNGPRKICRGQPLKQAISPQVFLRLSSRNFTRSILEYFVPFVSLQVDTNWLEFTRIHRYQHLKLDSWCPWCLSQCKLCHELSILTIPLRVYKEYINWQERDSNPQPHSS